jgi:hypothetical protein
METQTQQSTRNRPSKTERGDDASERKDGKPDGER